MSNKPLDPILTATIQQVVEDKVQKSEMFTAFDVSRTVQNMGHRERHLNMKHVVHDLFESGQLNGYNRTLVAVEPSKPEAWVYHPLTADPTQYKPTYQPLPTAMTPQSFYQQGAAGSGTPAPSISSVSFAPSTATAVRGKHRPDKRGAITVPAKLIKQIGAKAGDALAVEKDGSTLVISTAGAGRKYTVNTSLNIRIKRKTWGAIANGTGDFAFEEKSGKIVVSHK
mgnify:CR=1 FL=1